ncbi:hypothetical protein [Rhizobium leguminosarum]|nr:hypothetical protein U8Q02_43950 [Rhizobium leguminosarum]
MKGLRIGDPGYTAAVKDMLERFIAGVDTSEKAKAWFVRLEPTAPKAL